MGVEAAFPLVDDLHRSVPPRPEEGCDTCHPGPLPHPVKALACPHVVAELELVVSKEVAMGVEDPLREPGRARGVVQLRGVVGEGVDTREARVTLGNQPLVEHEDMVDRQVRGRARAQRSRRS